MRAERRAYTRALRAAVQHAIAVGALSELVTARLIGLETHATTNDAEPLHAALAAVARIVDGLMTANRFAQKIIATWVNKSS